MIRAGLAPALAVVLAACGEQPRPATPPPPPALDAAPEGTGLEPDRPALPEVPEEERIAAIEQAMNQLAPVANQCWAAAAAQTLAVAGDVRLTISVGPAAGVGAAVEVVHDTTDSEALTACLYEVLGAYAWAPPLAGQVIELPFHFDAPRMQNVIDRRLVPHRGQAGVDVAVLMDATNTGNRALALVEVAVAPGKTTPSRPAADLEVWMFRTPGTVTWTGGKAPRAVVAGDVMILRDGLVHTVAAPGEAALHAVVARLPGGNQGAARAGALPAGASGGGRVAAPVFLPAAAAKRYPRPGGATTIIVEPPAAGAQVSVGYLEIDAGVQVPAHVHARETEALYLLGGGGTMTVAGVALPVTEHSVVQVPPGVEHAFTASAATTAIQLYTPAGPEQRFKKPPAKP